VVVTVPGMAAQVRAAGLASLRWHPPCQGVCIRPPAIALTSHPCRSLFFNKEMELSLIGLQNAGKTSLVNVLTTGTFHEDMIPTVGFNMRKITKGGVTMKLWDLGGQVGTYMIVIRPCSFVAGRVLHCLQPTGRVPWPLKNEVLGLISPVVALVRKCLMLSHSNCNHHLRNCLL
jgi:hypothetical protein